jgi:flagellar hook-associated protein 1 FlgK
MSLISSQSMLIQAMQNFQVGIQTTANNVANAETVGYSKEVTQFSENTPMSYGSYVVGTGASVSGIERIRNGFLDAQVRQYSSQQSYSQTLSTALNQLASIFPDITSSSSTDGLSTQLAAFYSAWAALGANASPSTDNADKSAVISAATTLAETFRTTSTNLTNLLSNLNEQVQATMDDANKQMDLIASFNQQIKQMEAGGGTPNTLLDQREQAMEALAQDINVNYAAAADGTVTVYFNQGTLVQGANAGSFTAMDGVPHPWLVKVGFASTGSSPMDVTSQITGGKLGALISAENTTLSTIQSVQSMASGVIQNTNTVYHSAKDASGNSSNFFTGDNAASIAVASTLANSATGSNLLNAFRTTDADQGDLAKAIAATANDYFATFIQSGNATGITSADVAISTFGALGTLPTATGTINITMGTAATASVNWNSGQSMATIAANITAALGGAGVATYDDSTGKMTILTSQPVSLYDQSGNLSRVLKLTSIVESATNINATADPSITYLPGNGMPNNTPVALNSYQGLLDTLITSQGSGVITVDGVNVAWLGTADSVQSIAARISTTTGFAVVGWFDATTQRVMLVSTNAAATVANPLTTFTVGDVSGNFASLAALYKPSSVEDAYAGLQSNLTGEIATASTEATQATSSLTQVQNMISADSSVDTTAELELASQYRYAYEASARVLAIIDDMLDVVINGTSNNASASSSSSGI